MSNSKDLLREARKLAGDALRGKVYLKRKLRPCSCGEGGCRIDVMVSLEESVWDTWERDDVCLITSIAHKTEELAKAILAITEEDRDE